MKRLCSNLLLQEKSVWSGSTAPQASGGMIIRTGSMCRGMTRLFMLPFMPWQRQMGASRMTALRPSQHAAGAASTVRLVR